MKKLLTTFLLILFTTLAASSDEADSQMQDTQVWVCLSGNAYAYHSHRNCNGLCRCKHTIKQVSISKAQEMGFRPCQKCY